MVRRADVHSSSEYKKIESLQNLLHKFSVDLTALLGNPGLKSDKEQKKVIKDLQYAIRFISRKAGKLPRLLNEYPKSEWLRELAKSKMEIPTLLTVKKNIKAFYRFPNNSIDLEYYCQALAITKEFFEGCIATGALDLLDFPSLKEAVDYFAQKESMAAKKVAESAYRKDSYNSYLVSHDIQGKPDSVEVFVEAASTWCDEQRDPSPTTYLQERVVPAIGRQIARLSGGEYDELVTDHYSRIEQDDGELEQDDDYEQKIAACEEKIADHEAIERKFIVQLRQIQTELANCKVEQQDLKGKLQKIAGKNAYNDNWEDFSEQLRDDEKSAEQELNNFNNNSETNERLLEKTQGMLVSKMAKSADDSPKAKGVSRAKQRTVSRTGVSELRDQLIAPGKSKKKNRRKKEEYREALGERYDAFVRHMNGEVWSEAKDTVDRALEQLHTQRRNLNKARKAKAIKYKSFSVYYQQLQQLQGKELKILGQLQKVGSEQEANAAELAKYRREKECLEYDNSNVFTAPRDGGYDGISREMFAKQLLVELGKGQQSGINFIRQNIKRLSIADLLAVGEELVVDSDQKNSELFSGKYEYLYRERHRQAEIVGLFKNALEQRMAGSANDRIMLAKDRKRFSLKKKDVLVDNPEQQRQFNAIMGTYRLSPHHSCFSGTTLCSYMQMFGRKTTRARRYNCQVRSKNLFEVRSNSLRFNQDIELEPRLKRSSSVFRTSRSKS